eukprot:11034483-Alexandrium_andersonii.AAC.1
MPPCLGGDEQNLLWSMAPCTGLGVLCPCALGVRLLAAPVHVPSGWQPGVLLCLQCSTPAVWTAGPLRGGACTVPVLPC